MDVKTSAQVLQRHLIHHEKAKAQVKLIERQIKRQYRLAVRTVLKGHKGQSLHYMGIMTVLQSVRHFYQRYSHRSWLNVQMLARIIMQTMDPCRMLPPLEIPEDNFQCESGQSEKYQHALVVAHCNFSRAS